MLGFAPADFDLARVRQNANTRIAKIGSNRVIYLHIDHNRDQTPFATDKQGAVLPNNPLKNRRVRQALRGSRQQ